MAAGDRTPGTRVELVDGTEFLPGFDEWPAGGFGYWPGGRMWQLKAPNGIACSVSPRIHTVVEHDDGTISVSPSIRVMIGDGEGGMRESWHGFLVRGIWREV